MIFSIKKEYSKGYKYCSKCELYVMVNSVGCPRCGRRLRVSPRNNRSRRVRIVPRY